MIDQYLKQTFIALFTGASLLTPLQGPISLSQVKTASEIIERVDISPQEEILNGDLFLQGELALSPEEDAGYFEAYLDNQAKKKAAQAKVRVQVMAARQLKPSPEEMASLYTRFGAEYGIPADTLARIAACESGHNPGAINGPYGGLFQFHSNTWASNRRAMGLDANPDLRFNAEEAVRTAAFKMSRDGTGAWPVCQYR